MASYQAFLTITPIGIQIQLKQDGEHVYQFTDRQLNWVDIEREKDKMQKEIIARENIRMQRPPDPRGNLDLQLKMLKERKDKLDEQQREAEKSDRWW